MGTSLFAEYGRAELILDPFWFGSKRKIEGTVVDNPINWNARPARIVS
jgi:hypothetical protein